MRAAATINLCPEIAYFLSSYIAALRETRVSAMTGEAGSPLQILTATFQRSTQLPFQMEIEGSKTPRLSPMSR